MLDRTLRIGIYGRSQSETVHRVVAGMLRYGDEAGGFVLRDFRLTTLPADGAPTPQLWKGKVDGVVIGMGPGTWTSQAVGDWVVGGGVPAVNVTSDWFDARVPSFVVDRASVAELVTTHLIDCGCASFLHFGYEKSTGSRARADAFRNALSTRQLKLREHHTSSLYTGGFEDASAAAADTSLQKLLQSMRKPIGVWAVNDYFAHGLGLACEHMGLKLPEQVKLIGTDDLTIARFNQPKLSSIRTPSEEVGYQAMRTLHRMINGKRPARSITEIRATELIARESTVAVQRRTGDLDDVKNYIARHACSGINVDQIVGVAGMSRRAFEEWFREKVGHSPGEEILRVRLERAKHLLRTTDLTMGRISSMVGYANTPAFTRFFRNLTGRTPKEFRQANSSAIP